MWSLLPEDFADLKTLDGLATLHAEVLADELLVLFVLARVKLGRLVVLPLRMLFGEAVRDNLTTHEPDAHDLPLALCAHDGQLTEGVLRGVLRSGVEAIEQVVELVLLVRFLVVHDVVFDLPEGPALPVQLLEELVDAGAGLVLAVAVEGLEVVKAERRRRQGSHVVLRLLILLCGGRSGLLLRLLLFRGLRLLNSRGLQRLGAELDSTLHTSDGF